MNCKTVPSPAQNGSILYDHTVLEKKFAQELENFRKSSDEPTLNELSRRVGVSNKYLSKTMKKHQWAKQVLDDFNVLRKSWEKWIRRDEMINIRAICKEAGYPYDSFSNGHYEWQRVLLEELRNAKETWTNKQKERAQLEAEAIATKEAHLKPLKLVVYTPKELFERFIVKGVDIDEYRNVGVDLGKPSHFALAKLMYRTSKGVLANVKVDPKTFDPKRKTVIDGCIKVMQSYSSLLSSDNFLRRINKSFVYCQESKKSIPLPLSLDEAEVYYREYTLHLFKHFNKEQTSTYNKAQISIKTLLSLMYPKKHYKLIIKGVPDIPRGVTTHTSVEMDNGMHALSFYLNMFHQVADFIIDKHTAPHPISFNGTRMLIAPFKRSNIQCEGRTWKANGLELNIDKYYDFDAARLRSINDEALGMDRHQRNNYIATRSRIATELDTLNQAIQDGTSNHLKTSLLELSINAFFMVFSGLSGQTNVTICNAQWEGDDEFDINKEGYRIRTIKPRAGYRRFAFPVSVHLKTLLKKYLVLRRMLLNGAESDTLFPFKTYSSDNTYRRFSKIYSELPHVGTRQLRQLYNRVTLMKSGGDLILTAKIMGHTPETNDQYYNDSPQSIIYQQLDSFIKSMVTIMRDEKEIETKHAACVKGDQEAVSIIDNNMKLDCGNIFHCFICKHFRTHPVEEDIHKLMSFLFAIKFYLTGRAKGDPEFIMKTIEPTTKIIKTILEYMADKYGVVALIDEVFKRVFEHGKLSDDWDKFFILQKQLGAI